MFLDFYNLREQPFGVTPDPRYLYFSPAHREALASLFYGIETGRGFLSLIAEPGMGKTTLLFQLLKRWKGYIHSAFLFQTQCDSRELLRYLLEDLGLDSQEHDVVRMHSELNDFLYRETRAGKPVVVFIDESQNLSDNVLETVRLLSDFEAPDKKLLQIVLAGQPELGHRLSHPRLAQLRQRISIQARLDPLAAGEVGRYIHHRLQTAGYRGPGLFTPGALAQIAHRSQGIPRLINNICFSALSMGCANRSEKIDSDIVRDSVLDLGLDFKTVSTQVSDSQPTARCTPHFRARSTIALREKVQACFSWIKAKLLGERVAQSAAAVLLLTVVAAYVGVRSGASVAPSTAAIHEQTARASAFQGSTSEHAASEFRVPGQSEERPQSADGEASVPSFVYVIQPNDTLHDLCVSTIGRYDREAIKEIRKLNPSLGDLNHLEVGQQIRFPVSSMR